MSDKKMKGMIEIVVEARKLCKTWTTELYANREIDREAFKEALRSLGYPESVIELYE
jgi:hypothetical protein